MVTMFVLFSLPPSKAAGITFEEAIRTVCNDISNNVCVIKRNYGGELGLFAGAVVYARMVNMHVVVDGPCASGCVVFASAMRPNVCVTQNAKMMIHLGTIRRVFDSSDKEVDPAVDQDRYWNPHWGDRVVYEPFLPPYGDDINAWALSNNKIPGSPRYAYTLTRDEMLKFWKPCAKH